VVFVKESCSAQFLALHVIAQENTQFFMQQLYQPILLLFRQVFRRFNHGNIYILQISSKLTHCTEHISHHKSRARSHFNNLKGFLQACKVILHSCNHPYSQTLSKHLRYFRRGCEVSAFTENFVFRRVVTVLGM